jgi:hypothetical protein
VTRTSGLARAKRDSENGGISCFLDEAPEELPCRNEKAAVSGVIRADVHQSDEVAFPGARNGKSASGIWEVELLSLLLASDFPQFSPSADLSMSHDFR